MDKNLSASSTKLNNEHFSLSPVDNNRQANLCGPVDDNLKTIERRLGVTISYRGCDFTVVGKPKNCSSVVKLLKDLYLESQDVNGVSKVITPEMVHLGILEADCLEQASENSAETTDLDAHFDKITTIKTKRGIVKPRNGNQQAYVQNIVTNDISFGVGVAGTGKTYLAVACAVDALERQEVRRILLTRPAVEAGEKLGFLPGDLSQKIDPYLRPLYDALFEMLGFERVEKLIERNVIEIAPLAYMRGRTLNDAFIILDESQNTTVEQMKMFLTRIGFNSRAVITGDITQVDLPKHQMSGLRHAIEVLQDINGISFNFFQSKDVVRHPVVARVVDAYESYEQKLNREKQAKKSQNTVMNKVVNTDVGIDLSADLSTNSSSNNNDNK